jgi:hypothetical protein
LYIQKARARANVGEGASKRKEGARKKKEKAAKKRGARIKCIASYDRKGLIGSKLVWEERGKMLCML